MYGSGPARIGEDIMTERRIMPSAVAGAPTGWLGAVAGTTARPSFAPLFAAAAARALATTTWVSASRGRTARHSYPFSLLGAKRCFL